VIDPNIKMVDPSGEVFDALLNPLKPRLHGGGRTFETCNSFLNRGHATSLGHTTGAGNKFRGVSETCRRMVRGSLKRHQKLRHDSQKNGNQEKGDPIELLVELLVEMVDSAPEMNLEVIDPSR
jgi:hypothetical protein